jgi:hypothetical protein
MLLRRYVILIEFIKHFPYCQWYSWRFLSFSKQNAFLPTEIEKKPIKFLNKSYTNQKLFT